MTKKSGLSLERYFTSDEKNPYDSFEWETGGINITNDDGKFQFRQDGAEFPKQWSPLARKITGSKYFFGKQESPKREYSARQLIGRVSDTFREWAIKQNYFGSEKEANIFRDEIAYISLDQRMAFNSPVWFNVGTHHLIKGSKEKKEAYRIDENGKAVLVPLGKEREYPQTSACFIQGVEDTMEGIMELAKREALLFKYGSGTGTNLSSLRSSYEDLSSGGRPSGPLAYWAFYDKVAAIVKSGGVTRRAAKMDILNVDHPNILEFIHSKQREEEKIRILVAAGIPWQEAQDSVNYQNTNISVRATNAFMNAVESNAEWQTIPVHSKHMADLMPKYSARMLLEEIAKATHACGDPGFQFDDTINEWHTCPNSSRIRASNPCSEYMHVDDSSCNLASLNLMKFLRDDGTFDTESFSSVVRTTAIAQDLEFDNSSFPTKKIAQNSHDYRPLGMGYANLGSLVMSLRLSYDSDEACAVAASITSLLTGKVYETSTEMAEKLGTFKEYEKNKEPMLKVMRKHQAALKNINRSKLPKGLEKILDAAEETWKNVIRRGEKYGFRNAQATVLAPTGTIGFMMDCDTKGIEPEIGLVQTKLLSDGGTLRLVNRTVEKTLRSLGYDDLKIKEIREYVAGHSDVDGTPHLKSEHKEKIVKSKSKRKDLEDLGGYSEEQVFEIVTYLDGFETMEGAPHIREEHLPIFDCSNKPAYGKRTISYKGHLKMMAAVQPFLSGAISKTVNLPREATVEDIEQVYMEAWKMGLKAVALYRDGSKSSQPLSFSSDKKSGLEKKVSDNKPVRRKLPTTRQGIIHKFNLVGHEGYLIPGMYEDGTPGEIFINMSKEGTTIGGLMDVIGTLTSMSLQYGVPLDALVKKFRHQKFDPRGIVYEGHPEIHEAESIIDYVFHFLEKEFLGNGDKEENRGEEDSSVEVTRGIVQEINNKKKVIPLEDINLNEEKGGFCPRCGAQMFMRGHCVEYCRQCDFEDPKGCGQ